MHAKALSIAQVGCVLWIIKNMKFIAWLALIGFEVAATSCFALAPNEFYNRPSTLSQYAGYARNISPVAIPITLVFFGASLFKAQKKRDQLRLFCPLHLLQQFDSISLFRFLSISQKKTSKVLREYSLLEEKSISSEDYVINVLLGIYDEN
jgi:hypothetical protein